jgi:cytochrome oxidase Cu insertion factor (SCO1/SenC/PrrC family)
MKQKVETQEVDKIKSTLLLKEDEDKTVDVLLIEFDEDNDTHLVKRLREWMRQR